MKNSYNFIFSLKEIIKAEQIIADNDEKEALKFMKEILKKKIDKYTKDK